jgi:hypothetical protein
MPLYDTAIVSPLININLFIGMETQYVFCEVGPEIFRRSAAGISDRLNVSGLGCNARPGCLKTCPAGDCVKVAVNVGLGLHFCPVCRLAADQDFHAVRP